MNKSKISRILGGIGGGTAPEDFGRAMDRGGMFLSPHMQIDRFQGVMVQWQAKKSVWSGVGWEVISKMLGNRL